MNKKEPRIIGNTFDAPTKIIPRESITRREYLALGGIASVPLSPEESAIEELEEKRLLDVKIGPEADTPSEGVGSAPEARLHPHQLRD